MSDFYNAMRAEVVQLHATIAERDSTIASLRVQLNAVPVDAIRRYHACTHYDDSLRCDLLAKLPLRTRRWDGRRWIVRIDQADTLQAILAAHRVTCCWQRGG